MAAGIDDAGRAVQSISSRCRWWPEGRAHQVLLPNRLNCGCCATSMTGGAARRFAILRLGGCLSPDLGPVVGPTCFRSAGGNCANAWRTRAMAELSATL